MTVVKAAFVVSLLLVLAGTAPGRVGEAETLNFYIATNGSDAWSGKLAAPNDAKTDGPLASLEAARDALRKLRTARQLPGAADVHVRGGSYHLAKTFVLTEADSGTEKAPIIYRAYENEAVSLTGARTVADFQPVKDPGILSRLDPAARAKVLLADLKAQGITEFGEPTAMGKRPDLFFQNRPMTLARWPNSDFARVGAVKDGKISYDGDRPERWSAETDVWLHGYWFYDWSDSYQKVEAISAKDRLLTLAPPQHHYGYRQGQRYYALNVLAELDAPGEWYLDRQTGLLYFWPPSPLAEASVALSVVPRLVRLENVSWVTLRGLTLEACRDTAVGIQGGTGDVLADCVVRNTGGWGVEVTGGKGHRVTGCDVYGTGRGGIRVEGGDRPTLTPAGHMVENNHIHHFARLFRTYQPAVELQGVGLRVARNLIHDAPHAALHLAGNDHVVELNEVHDVCRETCDVGALYLGRDWTMRGNVIRHNFFHDIAAPVALSSMAVYLDDAASGFTVDGNIFHRVQYAVFLGGGRDNRIENNVFVDCKLAVHIDARGVGWMKNEVETELKPRLQAVPYQQPPWSRRYPSLVNILSDEPGLPKGNVVTRNISVGGTWADIEKVALPLVEVGDNLVDVNPLFIDPAKPDFRLRIDSPAHRLGFKPIPVDTIGIYRDEYRSSLPTR